MRRRRVESFRRVATGDRGSASVFVLGLIVVLMAVAGLVVDGGRAVNARAEIMDDAEQAARAGANRVDDAALRAGGPATLDVDLATEAASDFLVARGYDAARITTSANGAKVVVTVTDDVQTTLLSLLFIDSFEVEGSAVARAAEGIVTESNPGAP